MAKPIKRALSKRKVRCKCKCHQKAEMRKKGQQTTKNDTLGTMPVQMPRDNAVSVKVKIRKK